MPSETTSQNNRHGDGLPIPRRYLAVVTVALGTSLAVLDGSIVTVALPTIARDLGAAPSQVVSVVTVYQLVLVMTVLPFSALGNRIGLRTLYQAGQAVFLVATALCIVVKSLPVLLVMRGVQALGAAASLSVSSALIRSIYPTRQLGRGLGINNVVVASSNAMAPTLGGLILALASWPWIFVAAAPLALLSLLLGRQTLPEPEPHSQPYDVVAALLCALMFGLIISGLENVSHVAAWPLAISLLAAGTIVGTVFVRRECKVKMPILPVDLLAKPVLALATLGGMSAFVGSMVFMLSLPFRLQQHLGFSPGEVAAVITPWPLGSMVCAPLAGTLSDRYPGGLLGALGMAVVTAALLSLAFLPADVTHVGIAVRMAVCGMGFGFFLAPNARLIVHAAPPARAASAGGLISTTRLTGQTLGATVIAALLAVGVGGNAVPALVAAALTLLAGLCSLARMTPRLQS